MHNFTPNDILLYISGEMPLIESKAIEHAILLDSELFNYYYDMLNLWHASSNLDLIPSDGFEARLMSRLDSQQLAVA
jgi:hypothetical protein